MAHYGKFTNVHEMFFNVFGLTFPMCCTCLLEPTLHTQVNLTQTVANILTEHCYATFHKQQNPIKKLFSDFQ